MIHVLLHKMTIEDFGTESPKARSAKYHNSRKIRLLSLKVFVWLLSGTAGTCAGLRGNGKLPAAASYWGNSEVLCRNNAVKSGVRQCQRVISPAGRRLLVLSVCKRTGMRFPQPGLFVCDWKENKLLQESQ